MIVVSDTSVLINLAWINQLDVLQKLYGEVYIPNAVWDEIAIAGAGQPGAKEVQTAAWIKQQSPQNRTLVKSLQQNFDLGESEAIALALEINADLLLMDERLDGATANYFNLKVTGLIGVLIVAKQQNHVTLIKPLLDQLRSGAGFYISDALYQQVLQTVGE